jgi:SAM-dependent methyltransferase
MRSARALAGSIAAQPAAYDLIQWAVGAGIVNRRVSRALAVVAGVLLDVGAGTGLDADLRPAAATYIGLDLDPAKLLRLRASHPGTPCALGDATRLPIRSGSCAAVLLKAVVHHLDAGQLEALLREARRVLAPGGRLVVLDAVWAPGRWPGRLLWAADRGSYPRRPQELAGAVARHFQLAERQSFAILHRYALLVAEAPVS